MTEHDEQREHWRFETAMLRWILGLVSIALVGGMGWMWNIDRNVGTLNERVTNGIDEAERLDRENRDQDRQISAQGARLRTLEGIAARQDERWERVMETLDRIDGRLNEVLREK